MIPSGVSAVVGWLGCHVGRGGHLHTESLLPHLHHRALVLCPIAPVQRLSTTNSVSARTSAHDTQDRQTGSWCLFVGLHGAGDDGGQVVGLESRVHELLEGLHVLERRGERIAALARLKVAGQHETREGVEPEALPTSLAHHCGATHTAHAHAHEECQQCPRHSGLATRHTRTLAELLGIEPEACRDRQYLGHGRDRHIEEHVVQLWNACVRACVPSVTGLCAM